MTMGRPVLEALSEDDRCYDPSLSASCDPFDLIALATILLKLLFHKSWTAALLWDDPVPKALTGQ